MKRIHFVVAVVLAVLALSSCTNTDYKNVIPANAPLVMEVDIRSIAEQSEFQQSKTMKELEKGLSLVVSAVGNFILSLCFLLPVLEAPAAQQALEYGLIDEIIAPRR